MSRRENDLEGIRGWLLLYLDLTILYLLFNSLALALIFFNVSLQEDIDMSSFVGIYELFSYILYFISLILIIILIYSKRSFAPKLIIGMEGLILIFSVIDSMLTKNNFSEWIEFLVSFGLSVTWILYFIRSRRVKNTFIRA